MPSQTVHPALTPTPRGLSRVGEGRRATGAGPAPARRLAAGVLRVPLLAKIVVLNALLVAGATAAALSAAGASLPRRDFVLLVGLAGVGALALNYVVVSVALAPVRALESTASRVASGDYRARVPASLVADDELQALAGTLNALVDRVATDREQLRAFSAALIGAGDRERARLGRDLHDHTAQLLSALVLQLSVVPEGAGPSHRQAYADMHDLALTVLEDVRLHARTLYPRVLDDLGLPAALHTLASEAMARAPTLRVTVTVDPGTRHLPAAVASALYFTAQEAVANVVRHARAADAAILATLEPDDCVSLLVRDDGVGFDVGPALQGVGAHGVLALRERVALLDGSTTVHSAPGTGTVIHVRIPIPPTRLA